MGICTNLEASLTNKVLIWINCWSPFPSPTPGPPVQSDLVIWVDLGIDD
jgi:hypothetical protein